MAQQPITAGHGEHAARAIGRHAHGNAVVFAQSDRIDQLFFQIHRDGVTAAFQLDHFAQLTIVQAVDMKYAVAYEKHLAGAAHIHRALIAAQPFLQILADRFPCGFGHSSSSSCRVSIFRTPVSCPIREPS